MIGLSEIERLSAPEVLWTMDGRNRDARRIAASVRKWVSYCGQPDGAERAVIGGIAMLDHYIAQADAKAHRDGGMSQHMRREYLAWISARERQIRQLTKRTKAKRPRLQEIMASA